ncbi:hypothetical protein LOK49_LG14G01191 [Camellia lanceoleosa]|uniref:Uncharacterized protein n=1 Tax=Camellia lanceoleosa TaxID=1840588 RepID=A0ACC0FAV5_9ERIC|nr:hypothetical protein LOK49_LG14G01191 [Camellia lanceoleosa]
MAINKQAGEASPILDTMAMMLENISNITVIARTTIAAFFCTAQIVASIPNLSYKNKARKLNFCNDYIAFSCYFNPLSSLASDSPFSVVLVLSSVCTQASSASPESKNAADLARTLSRTISIFSSSSALFGKMGNKRSSANFSLDNKEKLVTEGQRTNSNNGMLNRIKSIYSWVYSIKSVLVLPTVDENYVKNLNKDLEVTSLRLSSRQISLLLSSIWAQSISPANMPGNYEAIAHTYSLVLLFSRGKNSSQETLVRSFQLAFSLKRISLIEGACNILLLLPCVKAALTDKTVDPFLPLVEDCKLQAVDTSSLLSKTVYGSKEDDSSASKISQK